jgi:hypothetical protein
LSGDILKIVHHAVVRGESVSRFVTKKLLWSLELGQYASHRKYGH